jgi:malonate decarboxylase delta subunit
MERLTFELPSRRDPAAAKAPRLVGVVASGNLEVLVEPLDDPRLAGRCRFEVSTSAHGFGEVWRAVLEDFAARRAVAGLSFSVNDAGATPAVVGLRLEQAASELLGRAP